MLLCSGNNGKYAANGVVCFLLFFFTLTVKAQNLVPNPSFELYDTCTYSTGFVGNSKPLYWEKWYQSPDYIQTCAGSLGGLDTLLGIPLNGFGFQYPVHGEAYVGLCSFGTTGGGVNYREYIGCQLVEPMEVGETYDLSFYTNVAVNGSYWWMRWASNNMGMLFTMQPNIWTGMDQPLFELRNYAHLYSSAMIADSVNWTLVSGSFVADSAYQFLVLGNFFSNSLTDTVHLVPGPSLGAYYFVDGICVTRIGQECSFANGIGEPEVGETFVWPNPTDGWLNVHMKAGMVWQIFDVTGRLVHSGVSTTSQFNLDVRDQAQGEYILKLESSRRHIRFVVIN